MYYKLKQACVTNWGSFVLLQIRENVVTNWGSFIIANCGKCCYKLEQLLQIRANVIPKKGSYYKLGQNLLQIGAGIQIRAHITNWGITQVFTQLSSKILPGSISLKSAKFLFYFHKK